MKLGLRQQKLLYKILDIAKKAKCNTAEVFYQIYWYQREWEEKDKRLENKRREHVRTKK